MPASCSLSPIVFFGKRGTNAGMSPIERRSGPKATCGFIVIQDLAVELPAGPLVPCQAVQLPLDSVQLPKHQHMLRRVDTEKATTPTKMITARTSSLAAVRCLQKLHPDRRSPVGKLGDGLVQHIEHDANGLCL